MADPEEIYQEVLKEEQAKGVSAPVSEGRAKAARARAEHGSPHPKEPKWWPGAQPHLEGDGAAPAEEAAEEPVAEEPAAEPEPAAPEPAEPAAAPAPAAPEPAAAPAAAAPAAEAAPAAAATATATSLPPEQRPAGVTHGVPTGNRLRPEDEVQTDAQFEAQQAVYQRRKLIDDVVSSGGAVPVETGPRSGQWALFLVYLAVVVGAIFFVAGQKDTVKSGPAEPAEPAGGGGVAVTAQNVAFDTDEITLPADKDATIEFTNADASSVSHNISIYEDESAKKALFTGDVVPGGQSITYEISPLKAGTYYFHCDIHPGMSGDVKVE